jgi:hypothetical protein
LLLKRRHDLGEPVMNMLYAMQGIFDLLAFNNCGHRNPERRFSTKSSFVIFRALCNEQVRIVIWEPAHHEMRHEIAQQSQLFKFL